jgi:hypothetical protein
MAAPLAETTVDALKLVEIPTFDDDEPVCEKCDAPMTPATEYVDTSISLFMCENSLTIMGYFSNETPAIQMHDHKESVSVHPDFNPTGAYISSVSTSEHDEARGVTRATAGPIHDHYTTDMNKQQLVYVSIKNW